MHICSIVFLAILLISTVKSQDEQFFQIDRKFTNQTRYDYLANTNEQGFIFEGISKYKNFRKCIERANEIYRYIDYHANQFLSGFYDGQWKMLDTGKQDNFESWFDSRSKQLTQKKSDEELTRMGKSFHQRGFTSGKVQFAVEFNKVKKGQMMHQQQQQKTTQSEQLAKLVDAGRILKDKSESFVSS